MVAPVMEECPFKLGDRVKVSPSVGWHHDWPGEYVVVGLTWDYQRGAGQGVNVWIASDDEIESGCGAADGWRVNDLFVVNGDGACPGFELPDGTFTGCNGSGGDCPVCGK